MSSDLKTFYDVMEVELEIWREGETLNRRLVWLSWASLFDDDWDSGAEEGVLQEQPDVIEEGRFNGLQPWDRDAIDETQRAHLAFGQGSAH